MRQAGTPSDDRDGAPGGDALAKVPQITLVFWLVKILATTLGETAGDAVSMSMQLGYLVGTALFAVAFAAAVTWQVRAERFHPARYWIAIIASTTVGTTLADFVDRSLGVGYAGGVTLLVLLLCGSLAWWHRATGSIDVAAQPSPRAERFYWLTIMLSQTLGTALGDWTADTAGMGYSGAAVLFGALLAIVALGVLVPRLPRIGLFWAAFVLTRPLGAVVGDLLDKPLAQGGLGVSRYVASAALLIAIVALLLVFPQRAAARPH